MDCPKCGREVPDDALMCCYCGKRLQLTKRKGTKRPNGTGNVYPRGSTWTARVVDHYTEVKIDDEKSVLRPVWKTKGGFKTKREALNYLPTLYEQTPNAERKIPTLLSYWNTFDKNELPKLSVSKQVAYRGAWKKLEKDIGHFPVDKITVSLLRETVEKSSNSYYTARDCKVVLSHLYKLIGADGWAAKDIPSFIVLPKLEEKEREVFSDDEQKALWKLYENGDMDAAVPLVMICTGMMPGEMQALKVEHINLEGRQIVGVGMKTKVRKASPIFLPNDIIPVLEDLIRDAQPSGYIFKRVEKEWYARYYAALEKAKCRRLEPYCCRHSTATRLAITEGVAPQTIQRMMRWSTTKMLDRYAHPDATDVLAAANMIKKPE